MSKRKETKVITDTLSRKWKKYLKRLSSKKIRQKEKKLEIQEVTVNGIAV